MKQQFFLPLIQWAIFIRSCSQRLAWATSTKCGKDVDASWTFPTPL